MAPTTTGEGTSPSRCMASTDKAMERVRADGATHLPGRVSCVPTLRVCVCAWLCMCVLSLSLYTHSLCV